MQEPVIEVTTETDPRLLAALASLNQIGAAINRISPGDSASVETTLRLIVESAIKVVPNSSSVIYTYDAVKSEFNPASRVSAGERIPPVLGDEPRPDGMGRRAVDLQRRVLSYQEDDLAIHPIKVHAGAKVVACFPLIVAFQAVGALYIYLHHERRFSQLELMMLENFVNQAAMAIYKSRRLADVERDLARKEDELNRLRHASLLLSSRMRLEETLEAILQMAMEVTGARYGIIRLVDKNDSSLLTGAVAGERLGKPLVETLPIDTTSVMGWVAKHRQPVLIQDLHAEPWVHIYYPLYADLEMRSELAVPLIGASGRLEGVLNLESQAIGAFDAQDRHLLQSLATQAVIAIQEVQLLDAVQEVAQLLLSHPCQHVLTRLAELACDLLNVQASAIWTLEADQLSLQAANTGFQRGEFLPLHQSLTGQAILQKRPVTSDDVSSDPRFFLPELAKKQKWVQALVVPLLAGSTQEPIGAFSVYISGSEQIRFTSSGWDEKVLTCLAHYAALAVQNAERQEELLDIQEQHAVAETFAAVGDIAANVLHHLNNKVGAIPVRIQGIQDKCHSVLLNEPYLSANLAEIERSALDAMEAVRENLTLLHPVHLGPVDLESCVLSSLKALDLSPGIQVRTKDLDALPPVVAGEQSLVLVFTNLFENAANAMGKSGKLFIQGSLRENWVHVDVIDNGPGIDSELHDRIFELNFSGRSAEQSGKQTSRVHNRLGFGLWWVKTLMTRLGGSISVESDGQHGTTFHLRLPRLEHAS